MNKWVKLIVFALVLASIPVLFAAAGGASGTFTFGSVDAVLEWWGAGSFQGGDLTLDIHSPDSSGQVPVILWCGNPGNGQIVPGNGVNPTVGDYSGATELTASNIVRKGRVHGNVSADPDQAAYASLVSYCPNANWYVAHVLPLKFVAELTVVDGTTGEEVLNLSYQCDATSLIADTYEEMVGQEIPCKVIR